METFVAQRMKRSYTHTIDASPSEIFPLLCPVREYDWIEGWACEMVYSESGVAENNCIFKTDLPHEGKEVWIVSRYEKDRAIEFVRVTHDLKVNKLDISLESDGNGSTTLVWTQTFTGMSDDGNEIVKTKTDEAYNQYMPHLDVMIRHYLKTGERLQASGEFVLARN